MGLFRLFTICLALICGATFARAEVELHAIGINESANNLRHKNPGEDVPVLLDRPRAGVVLYLGSNWPVRWVVTVTAATTLDHVVIYGRGQAAATVLVNDQPFAATQYDPFGAPYKTIGRPFRNLVETATAAWGKSRLDSFSGAYKAPKDGFAVTKTDPDNMALAVDHLSSLIMPVEAVPITLRPALNIADYTVEKVSLTSDGFVRMAEDGRTEVFPLDRYLPKINWPVAAVEDPEKQMLYGVTLGGEGFIYAYSVPNKTWSVLASMEGIDAVGMILSADTCQLITSGLVRRTQNILIQSVSLCGEETQQIEIAAAEFAGFTDLYDPENGPPAVVTPFAVANGKLLLRAKAEGGMQLSRMWMLDLVIQHVSLIAVKGG